MALASLRALACVAVLVLASCSSGDDTTVVGRAGRDNKLTIGVAFDQPGLGVRRMDGVLKGFDIDVARYVATELGVEESGITWVEVSPPERENMITSGRVDFVVTGYSITPKRKEVIDFVGPYFIAGQDLLVRMDDTRVTGPESLAQDGVRLCSTQGSTSAQHVIDEYAPGGRLVEYPQFSDCVTALLAENVDALTTDDVILAGYAAQNPEVLRVVGKPFSKEEYGIGLRKGDTASKTKITEAVRKMMTSGEWRKSLEANIGRSGYKIPEPPELVP
ncbi:glutamate ABC transporter substrate-binding protein [Saccharothrix violaceirubra]|uniref:Glutamate transport system substrate-binding protein n=1 Tax=Saccharothrix violaceirubra TaxID=413306 RepID=A0A7W7WXX5_9PSEU|nr:glutamate ABC transporter substrate-binding protein [Saccharothrix violaceirubra]MBB4967622.1 glutamate transport system substrate-binding protein [Saccharothrix violaceirubra]